MCAENAQVREPKAPAWPELNAGAEPIQRLRCLAIAPRAVPRQSANGTVCLIQALPAPTNHSCGPVLSSGLLPVTPRAGWSVG